MAIAVIAILCVVLLWQILKRKDEIPEKEIENFYKGDPSAINPEMTYDEQVTVSLSLYITFKKYFDFDFSFSWTSYPTTKTLNFH